MFLKVNLDFISPKLRGSLFVSFVVLGRMEFLKRQALVVNPIFLWELPSERLGPIRSEGNSSWIYVGVTSNVSR